MSERGKAGCLVDTRSTSDSFADISGIGPVYVRNKEEVFILKERLFISAEMVVAGLLLEQQSYYVDLDEIESFCSFLKNQVLHGTRFAEYRAVFVDAGLQAVARMAQYRSHIFDLVGDRLYLKVEQNELLSLASLNPLISHAIHDFVANL